MLSNTTNTVKRFTLTDRLMHYYYLFNHWIRVYYLMKYIQEQEVCQLSRFNQFNKPYLQQPESYNHANKTRKFYFSK